ncbi:MULTISPECIES: cytochrome ubiquinol oxidase subunit I [unclassified Cyanobium]|uniref:cytochrome ubiquinol oxidase subunit I n=1 Tax=unclassified Cyanobium TaxID=2627006 RepID=UPI0020CF9832|nr:MULTISPECIES: cytochrome ubiquinol oxidase subunit I [unclassified Cyanobium]MCP9834181.1 cytochrome ubiquinol oxidase subunit I [Cyanobium sp. La Preciosa 7G6]MCP9936944.1 cytochrome ubiquinol oxidase subunit I [Cyanobium sp. Aljojuca 7A6]
MDWLADTVVLSRMQFALTAIFHMLWPVLSTGLAIFLVILEALWLRTQNPLYYRQARFWAKLYVLNFGIGVASGLPMEFQFGTNWAPLSEFVGDFFGAVLGFEGAMAFMLEAGFLGIMLFGWNRVPPVIHFLSTVMVAFGANLSVFWILSANSWLQTPAGGSFSDGHFHVENYFTAINNPFMLRSVLHMSLATVETSMLVVAAISAWSLLSGKAEEFFSFSFRLALVVLLVVAPLQIVAGHESGLQVAEHQPTKLAAMEAIWENQAAGEAPPWTVIVAPDENGGRNRWAVGLPGGLSWILEGRPRLSQDVRGLNSWPADQRPRMVGLIFYAFRLMAGIGVAVAALMGLTVLLWWRTGLTPEFFRRQAWLSWCWILAAPAGYLAIESGWIVRCVGRQPWTVYGQLRTSEAASQLPAQEVLISLSSFAVLYGVLLVFALVFGARLIRKGPDLTLDPPTGPVRGPLPLPAD